LKTSLANHTTLSQQNRRLRDTVGGGREPQGLAIFKNLLLNKPKSDWIWW